jgi:outer membrane protein assembly factor BamB
MKWINRPFLWLVLAAMCVMLSVSTEAQATDFLLTWQRNGERGWAEHPIIRNGTVYVPWNNGDMTAIDVTTGDLLHSVAGVANATAPFVVNNYLYSYGATAMYEIALDTFQISRTITISNAWYTENVPYDAETGYFFVRQVFDLYRGRVTAIRLSDGMPVWSYPNAFEGGFDGHQNILLVGDSVFFQSINSFWQDYSMFYRVDKRTGSVIWSKPLSSIAIEGTSRGGYNNPIYDEDHDVIYVSEGWNGLYARVYAFRRSDGELLWSKDIPDRTIESTMTYYANFLYLPLHVFNGHGSYMALAAINGETIWHEPGFFSEDGWSATAVDARYLYRVTHGGGAPHLIVQDRLDGSLIWSEAIDASADCFNPVLSNGMVLLGSETSVYALKAADGQAVDSDFHGKNSTGYNPGAINWMSLDKLFLPFIMN